MWLGIRVSGGSARASTGADLDLRSSAAPSTRHSFRLWPAAAADSGMVSERYTLSQKNGLSQQFTAFEKWENRFHSSAPSDLSRRGKRHSHSPACSAIGLLQGESQ